MSVRHLIVAVTASAGLLGALMLGPVYAEGQSGCPKNPLSSMPCTGRPTHHPPTRPSVTSQGRTVVLEFLGPTGCPKNPRSSAPCIGGKLLTNPPGPLPIAPARSVTVQLVDRASSVTVTLINRHASVVFRAKARSVGSRRWRLELPRHISCASALQIVENPRAGGYDLAYAVAVHLTSAPARRLPHRC